MPTRNVVLTDRQAGIIERFVKSGRYQNASEVLRAGLRLIETQEVEAEARLKALRQAVRIGIEDVDAGRYRVLSSATGIREHFSALTDRLVAERTSPKPAK